MSDGKIAFVFSGQGAQCPGMGKALCETSEAAAAVFAMADRIRPGTSQQCFQGTKEELDITINTQPCLFTVDLASTFSLLMMSKKNADILHVPPYPLRHIFLFFHMGIR